MSHDPMHALDLHAIEEAATAVTAARQALADAEATRDNLIRAALASTTVRGAKARIARVAGLTDQRVSRFRSSYLSVLNWDLRSMGSSYRY